MKINHKFQRGVLNNRVDLEHALRVVDSALAFVGHNRWAITPQEFAEAIVSNSYLENGKYVVALGVLLQIVDRAKSPKMVPDMLDSMKQKFRDLSYEVVI